MSKTTITGTHIDDDGNEWELSGPGPIKEGQHFLNSTGVYVAACDHESAIHATRRKPKSPFAGRMTYMDDDGDSMLVWVDPDGHIIVKLDEMVCLSDIWDELQADMAKHREAVGQ